MPGHAKNHGYRPDIDGLRALAVLSVVFYHAEYSWVQGGYVGVDIFFVISGYLITNILICNKISWKYIITDFYVRRIRRIIPAFAVVLFATTVASTIIIAPGQLHDFFRSVIASIGFGANIYFWLESGYFGSDAKFEPLLHLWSLSVEEQFYIFLPMIFLCSRKYLIFLISVITILSISFSFWLTRTMPSFAFFMLPTRAFELLVGVVLALFQQYNNGRIEKTPDTYPLVKEAGALAGLLFIFFAIRMFDSGIPFPGVVALLPAIGAACFIGCSKKGTFIYRLMSSRSVVSVGLVSYSLYLWHYPIFALSRHLNIFERAFVREGLIALSLLLAFLTWRWVEQPFRKQNRISTPTVLFYAAASTAVFLTIGIVGHNTKGFRETKLALQMNERQRMIYELVERHTTRFDVYDDGECMFPMDGNSRVDAQRFSRCADQYGPAIVVFGDSHGINVYNILTHTGRAPFIIGMVSGGCRAHESNPACSLDSMTDFLVANGQQIDRVIYHQSGSVYIEDELGATNTSRAFDGGSYSFDVEALSEIQRFVEQLESLLPGKVWWLGPFAEYRFEPVDAVFDPVARRMNQHSVSAFNHLERFTQGQIAHASTVPYVGFHELFDLSENAIVDDCFMFRDRDHFSNCGEQYLADNIINHSIFSK